MRKKLMHLIKNRILTKVIFLLILTPLFINIGLVATDIIYARFGITLTAKGLDNKSWLDFWKDYMSVAIAFLGVYLVWDSSNKDRKVQCYRDISDQYFEKINNEEITLVEVAQCFNIGVIHKVLIQANDRDVSSLRDAYGSLQNARDKIDEAHIKFELRTSLLDDFISDGQYMNNTEQERNEVNEIRCMFYDMEKHYVNLLNIGEDYLKRINDDIFTNKRIDICNKLIYEINARIAMLQGQDNKNEEVKQLHQQLHDTEQNLKELQETRLCQDEIFHMLEPAINEVNYISRTMRPKFIGHCKRYMMTKKKYALKIRSDGIT